jgi:hypothetical protein
MADTDVIEFVVQWKNTLLHIKLRKCDTIQDLKKQLEQQTGVEKNFQKILIKGVSKLPSDFVSLYRLYIEFHFKVSNSEILYPLCRHRLLNGSFRHLQLKF